MIRLGLVGIALSLVSGVAGTSAVDTGTSGVYASDVVAEDSGSAENSGNTEDSGTAKDSGDSGNTGDKGSSSVSENGGGDEHTEEEVFECTTSSSVYWISGGETIEDSTNKYGDVFISADKGHVGDEVIVTVAGNPTIDATSRSITLYKYALSYVTLNGEKLEATDSEKGEYRFRLREGLNDVRAYFSGRVELSTTDLSTINWKSLLTVDNLLKLVYFVLTLILSSGCFLTIIKSKKFRAKTTEEVSELVQNVARQVVSETTAEFLKNTVGPLLEKQGEENADMSNTLKALMRTTLYTLDDTPESRLAAIKELQNYKSSDKELAKQIEDIVHASMKAESDKKAAAEKAAQEARESVNNFDQDVSGSDDADTGNVYGKL